MEGLGEGLSKEFRGRALGLDFKGEQALGWQRLTAPLTYHPSISSWGYG